jgi:hypothetical protein
MGLILNDNVLYFIDNGEILAFAEKYSMTQESRIKTKLRYF